MNTVALQIFQRQHLIHAAVNGSDYRHRPLLHQPAQNFQPLPHNRIAVNIGRKENNILGRIQIYLAVVEPAVLVNFFCLPFIVRDNQLS